MGSEQIVHTLPVPCLQWTQLWSHSHIMVTGNSEQEDQLIQATSLYVFICDGGKNLIIDFVQKNYE